MYEHVKHVESRESLHVRRERHKMSLHATERTISFAGASFSAYRKISDLLPDPKSGTRGRSTLKLENRF